MEELRPRRRQRRRDSGGVRLQRNALHDPIDERLEAAARRDRARLGQLEIEPSAGLRPRDIQARNRSGESAESVATTAGITMERGCRYAGPVLAEREHMAREARCAVVRRPAADGAPPRLGDIATGATAARDVDVETVTWDAWRRGRWPLAGAGRLDDSTPPPGCTTWPGAACPPRTTSSACCRGERAPDADDVSLLADGWRRSSRGTGSRPPCRAGGQEAGQRAALRSAARGRVPRTPLTTTRTAVGRSRSARPAARRHHGGSGWSATPTSRPSLTESVLVDGRPFPRGTTSSSGAVPPPSNASREQADEIPGARISRAPADSFP